MARKCCPDYAGSVCGKEQGHGDCMTITLSNKSSVRDSWPHYFNHVCVCTENYAGYDCSRCKYGYYGENCSEFTVIERKPISKLSPDEWKDYLNVLNMTRMHDSGYKVFLKEPDAKTLPSELQQSSIKLYDLFVWQHHYPAKDYGKLKM